MSSTTSDIINELSTNKSHKILESFEQLDNDFFTNPDYLLKRLVNSETNEKTKNIVTQNNGITEETTLTLQPPLNFQDNPSGYSQDNKNDIYYTADLAADSTTHFRPIRDDASIVECVNGDVTFDTTKKSLNSIGNDEIIDNKTLAPPLPARNHINRISVNQINDDTKNDSKKIDSDNNIDMPILPPKPLPRKDSKLKRKRLPPPPPPPTAPRRDIPPQVSARNLDLCKTKLHDDCENKCDTQFDVENKLNDNNNSNNNEVNENNNNNVIDNNNNVDDDKNIIINNKKNINNSIENSSMAIELDNNNNHINELIFNESLVTKKNDDTSMSIDKKIGESQTNNKILKKNNKLEIIEMKKMKVYNESSKNNDDFLQISPCQVINDNKEDDDNNYKENLSEKEAVIFVPAPRNSIKILSSLSSLSTTSSTLEDEDDEDDDDGEKSEESIDVWEEARDEQDDDDNLTIKKTHDIVDEENYESFDTIEDETEIPRAICVLKDIHGNEEIETRFDSEGEEDDVDDDEDNGDDYYWQSNLATIGEEEETTSLEYTSV